MFVLLAACSLPTSAPEVTPVLTPTQVPVAAPGSTVRAIAAKTERLGGARFRPPTGAVDVAFAPDETWMVAVDEGGSLHRFSLPDGAPSDLQSPCESAAVAVALAPDGKVMAVACDYDSIRIVDVATGASIRNLPGSAEQLRWAEDGSSLGIWGDQQMRWVDNTGRVQHRLAVSWETDWDNSGGVWAVLNAGESAELNDTGAARGGNALVVFEPGKPERFRHLIHGEAVAVALSDDGGQVVMLNRDRTLTLNAMTGEKVAGHALEDSWLSDLVRGQSSWFAIGEGRLWQLDDRLEVISFTEAADYSSLRASSKGTYIVGLGTSRPGLWRHDGEDLVAGDGLPDVASMVATSSNGRVVAGATWDGSLYWADRTSGAHHTLSIEGGAGGLDVSPDGRTVAVAVDAGLRLITTESAASRLVRLDDRPDWLRFAPDGTLYILDGYDPVLLSAIDVAQDRVVSTYALQEGCDGQSATLSPDGSTLVVPMDNGQLDVITLH